MLKKLIITILLYLICCSAVCAQAFGILDLRLGSNTLQNQQYDDNHTSFSWGMGFSAGSKIGKYGIFSGGFQLNSNTAWGSEVDGGYYSDGENSSGILDAVFDIGTLQLPFKP